MSSVIDRNLHPGVGTDGHGLLPASRGRSSNESSLSERSSRGATAVTSQVKLRPSGPDNGGTFSDSNVMSNLEFGDPDSISGGFILQPQDTGFGAWSYVAAAFSMYIVVWGFPNSFPIFQNYLSSGQHAVHSDSVALAVLAPGIQDILEGIFFPILPKLARFRRLLVILGIAIMSFAVLLASYATTPWQIVLTQGLCFGIGGIILNFVHVSVFVEWFSDEKQSQAMAIIWLGYRIGELTFPLVCQQLLDRHGFAETLRVLIAPMLALLLPSVFLLRGRYPVAQVTTEPTEPAGSKLMALRSFNVVFHLLVSLMLDLVINVPTMFISRFGTDIKLDAPETALALSLYTLCNMIGTYVFGWLSHSGNYEVLLAFCAASTSIAHFGLWGFCKTKFGLLLYATVVGLTSGGQDNCLYPFYSEISGSDGDLFRAIHSLFSFVGGLAILSVGPVGVALLRLSPAVNVDSYAIGKYKYLVIYAGGLDMMAAFSMGFHLCFWRRLSRVT